MIKGKKIVLGSSSPRRQELLKMIVKEFKIKKKETDESYTSSTPEKIVKEIAEKKLNEIEIDDDEILITADTIVYFDGEILLKPKSKENAIDTLKKMKNNWHQVYTGVCIKKYDTIYDFIVKTNVHFRSFSDETVLYYVENYNVYDKAGAYGIQDFGAVLIDEIRGDYYNIMGLPISELYQRLKTL
ncbi:MAG: nucleoside triphosphate pyrophosphatase [Geotoga sp.]|jgi:septum formation protein|nr:nucleoside triphosphate pyrophosphatase [Geotoga sp.]